MAGDGKIKAEAEVVVNTRGVDDALRKAKVAVDRTARDSKKSTDSQAKEQDKLTKAQEREAKKRADAERRMLDATAREERRQQEAQTREYERYQRRLSQLHNDEVHRRAQREMEAERKSLATREKLWRAHWKNVRGFAGGVVGGAVAGGAVAASTARGLAGVQDVGTRFQNALDYKQRAAKLSAQASLSGDDRAAMNAQIAVAANASGKQQSELIGVLEAGQAKFNNLKFFAENLEDIAVASTASSADAKDFAVALGYIKQAFGLTADEAKDMAGVMVAAANAGSIEISDFATNFASVAGTFAANTGLKGVAGARQFIGASQAAGTLGSSAAETATLVQRLTMSLKRSDVRKKLKNQGGIDVEGKDIGQIIAEMATSKKFNSKGVAEKTFGNGDILSTEAREALTAAHERVKRGEVGAIDVSTISKVDSQKGRDAIQAAMNNLEDEGLLKTQRQAVALQQDTIDNFGLYNDQIAKVTQATIDLQLKMGDTGRTLDLWKESIGASGLGAAGGRMLSGGGGGEGGGLLSTTLETVGASAVGGKALKLLGKIPGIGRAGAVMGRALPWLGRALPWAARAAAVAGPRALAFAGPIGAAAATAYGAYQLYDWLTEKSGPSGGGGGGQPARGAADAMPSAPAPTSDTGREILGELRKSTKLQEQLVQRTPQRPAQAGNGNRGSR